MARGAQGTGRRPTAVDGFAEEALARLNPACKDPRLVQRLVHRLPVRRPLSVPRPAPRAHPPEPRAARRVEDALNPRTFNMTHFQHEGLPRFPRGVRLLPENQHSAGMRCSEHPPKLIPGGAARKRSERERGGRRQSRRGPDVLGAVVDPDAVRGERRGLGMRLKVGVEVAAPRPAPPQPPRGRPRGMRAASWGKAWRRGKAERGAGRRAGDGARRLMLQWGKWVMRWRSATVQSLRSGVSTPGSSGGGAPVWYALTMSASANTQLLVTSVTSLPFSGPSTCSVAGCNGSGHEGRGHGHADEGPPARAEGHAPPP